MQENTIQSSQFRKNFVWNILGTTINACTSIVYMIIATRLNGLEQAGIFSFAFSNACVLSVVGTYMGRSYQISDHVHTNIEFLRVRRWTCFGMLAVLLVMILANDYSAKKIMLLWLWVIFKALEAYADGLYGIMQKNDRLDLSGKSLTIRAFLAVLAFVLVDYVSGDVALASLATVVSSVAVLILYDMRHARQYYVLTEECRIKECGNLLKDGFFVFGTTLLSTYLVNAAKYAIDAKGTDADQAIYGIIVMPATAMILVGLYLIQPFIVSISDLYVEKKKKELIRIVLKILIILFGIGVLGVVCAATIGIPVLQLIYGTDLADYKIELVIIIVGAIFYALGTVIVNVLIVMHKNRSQFLALCLVSAVTVVVAPLMVVHSGLRGASVSYALSMFMLLAVVLLIMLLNLKKEWK